MFDEIRSPSDVKASLSNKISDSAQQHLVKIAEDIYIVF